MNEGPNQDSAELSSPRRGEPFDVQVPHRHSPRTKQEARIAASSSHGPVTANHRPWRVAQGGGSRETHPPLRSCPAAGRAKKGAAASRATRSALRPRPRSGTPRRPVNALAQDVEQLSSHLVPLTERAGHTSGGG